MKILLTIILLNLFSLCIAQTYVGPVIGLNLMDFKSDNEPSFFTHDKSFSIESALIGFKFEQRLGKKFYLSYQFNYTRKKVKATTNGSVAINLLRFSYLSNKINLKILIKNNYYIGLGINFGFLNNVQFYLDQIPRDRNIESISGKGIHLCFGKKYKNFDLELLFDFGLTSYEYFVTSETFKTKPINSIELNLSYDIKIGDSIIFKKQITTSIFK